MRGIFALSLLLALAMAVVGQDGILEQARQEVRSPRSEAPAKSENKEKSSSSSWEMDEDASKLLGYGIFYTAITPFYLPHNLLRDDFENKGVFLSYPYAEKWDGIMQMEPGLLKEGATPDTWSRLMSLRIAAEEGNDFSGLNRVGLVFLADTMTRFGVGGSVHFYEEKRELLPTEHTKPPLIRGRYTTDELTIGDVNLLFRFAQSQHWQWRTGLGFRWLHDPHQTDVGFNFVYGVEWFPREPVTLGVQFEAGTLGNTGVIRLTSKVGLVWKRAEAYVGYDYLQIGGAELRGPMVGLRVWF